MKPCSVLVFVLCIFSALAEDSSIIPQGVGEVINLFNECRDSGGLAPCLKIKALALIDRVSRMEKITLMDGVEINGKTEETANTPTLEDEEKTLPRSIDAKDEALSTMIINRLFKMIGSKTLEISVPKLVETARKEEEESILDKFGGEEGGGGGGGGGQSESKKEQGQKQMFMQMFVSSLLAKKIAMLPLYIGALFILALKALITSKAALLIIGSIVIKKLIASKHHGGGGGGGTSVHHISAGHGGGGGGHGGWIGGGGGGGWEGGWDRRSFEEAQNLAFKSHRPT